MNKLNVNYILSISPLIFGSGVFYTWFILRVYFAISINIEMLTLFAVGFYILAFLALIIIGIVKVSAVPKSISRFIVPICISLLTVPVILYYLELKNTYSDKVFIRIINDMSEFQIARVWTSNFSYSWSLQDNILSYDPVYVYKLTEDGRPIIHSSVPEYTINPLYLDIRSKNSSSLELYEPINLGSFGRGTCKTIRLSELTNVP